MMTNREILSFAVGTICGAASMWIFLKDKYEKKYQEEIEQVKNALKKDLEERVETANKERVTVEKPDIMEYTARIKNLNYIPKTKDPVEITKGSEDLKRVEMPYVISPADFKEIDEYDSIELTYYEEDEVLVDDLGEPIDTDIVGDALSHFGEYEDDSVFCRDDIKKCDYEILLDHGSYAESKSVHDRRQHEK